MYKRILAAIAAFALTSLALGASLQTYTASWSAATQGIDGSALTAPVTYQVYVGTVSGSTKDPYGAPVASLSEIVVPSVPGLMCITVTSIAGGLESSPSNEACVTVPSLAVRPKPPANVVLK